MKILIHSNAPQVNTGYGVQCRLVAERLHDAGHEVAISATYGIQGFIADWRPKNPRNPEKWPPGEAIRIYPTGYETNGNDVLHDHAMHFFGGDPLGGWIIPLLDVWCLINPLLADFNVAAWTPVDHFPVPPGVIDFFERTDAVPVAMARFGEKNLREWGLDPVYVPLAVDTEVYKPTPTIDHNGREVTGRELIDVPADAFVVGMVAMNKDPYDRKGFNEAFAAFGAFWRQHNDAVLYVHSDPAGMGSSFNLRELATKCSIPPHAIVFPAHYAHRLGFPDQMMAATYSAFDVLLAPSHGEGFCVPLIEAQACGTPVIVTDFSAQPELVGAGWKVSGQQQFDAAQKAFYVVPSIPEIVDRLEDAYTADRKALAVEAIDRAAGFNADRVFAEHWLPLLELLDGEPEPLDLDREAIGVGPGSVAVLVPAMLRPQNVARLVESLSLTAPEATAYFVCDPDDIAEIDAVKASGAQVIEASGSTFAMKLNDGLAATSEPWLLVCGDDVEFHPGWLAAARKVSDRFDVIGTNDTAGPVKNPDVAAGRHADHFLVRRAYVDAYGACLDGPGVLAPEVYEHFYTDKEIVELARMRGVFTPCLESIVEHHHPGYEDKPRDLIYAKAIASSRGDHETYYGERWPLIEQHRTTRGKR